MWPLYFLAFCMVSNMNLLCLSSLTQSAGVYVYMVFQSYHLLKNLKRETPRKRKFYIAYGFIQLFLVTVELSLTALAGQLMWIDHRGSPGGPFAYYLSIGSGWFGVSVIACAVISIGMADALLVSVNPLIGDGRIYTDNSAIPMLYHLEWQSSCHITTISLVYLGAR